MQRLRILFIVISVFTIVSCREDAISFEVDNEWIGLWESEQDAIEIRENGTGIWRTNAGWRNRDKIKGRMGILGHKYMEINGAVLIQDDKLKIGLFKKDKRKKIFTVDEYPTDGVDNSGNAYTYIILDGEALTKTY